MIKNRKSKLMTWPIKKLGEVATISSGATPSRMQPNYYNGGTMPWVKSGELFSGIVDKTEEFITHQAVKDTNLKILPIGTPVVAMYGATAGTAAILGIEATTNQAIANIQPITDIIDHQFIYYFLVFKKNFLINRRVGGAQPNINQNVLRNLEIPEFLLNKVTQKKIVERLDAIRKAQELCDQQIQKNEELFESLLIQEFSTKSNWKIQKLPEIAKVQRGKFTPRPRNDPRYFGGDIPWIQTGDITNSDGTISDFSQTLNKEGLKVSKVFPRGTIVLTIAANIGDLAILEIDAAFPDSIVGINIDESVVNNRFLYFSMLLKKDYLNNQATQAAQKNINIQILSKVELGIPSMSEQQKIVEKLEAVQNYKKLLLKQKSLLKELFDCVLDKSMKGELD